MKALHYSVVMRRFCRCETKIVKCEAKLSVFQNSLCPFSPTVSLHDKENSVTNERVRLQASKMWFLKKIKGVTSLTRCTSLKI